MSDIWEHIRTEPVRVVAAIQATLACAVLFGLDLSPEQLSGLVIAVAAWLALVTRKQVVATHDLHDRLEELA